MLLKGSVINEKDLGIMMIIMTLGIMVLVAGCSYAKISDIKANPSQYEGKVVTVSGTVNETYWLSILSTGAYQIDDGSGTIWVVVEKAPPAKGEKTTVKGKVTTAVTIGDRSFGTVITETD